MKISSQSGPLDSPRHNAVFGHLSYDPARLFGTSRPSPAAWMSWHWRPEHRAHGTGPRSSHPAASDS
jgi:hypothetical protein